MHSMGSGATIARRSRQKVRVSRRRGAVLVVVAPGTLSATAVSGTRIDLAWGAATDDLAVTGYRIERCQGAGCTNFVQIAAPTGTATSYSDTTVVNATSYSYRVRAVDAAGNLSGYGNTGSVATPDTQSPSAPGTLSATALSSGRIDLAWIAATDNVAVTGYQIERCVGGGCSNFTALCHLHELRPDRGARRNCDQLQRHGGCCRHDLPVPGPRH